MIIVQRMLAVKLVTPFVYGKLNRNESHASECLWIMKIGISSPSLTALEALKLRIEAKEENHMMRVNVIFTSRR